MQVRDAALHQAHPRPSHLSLAGAASLLQACLGTMHSLKCLFQNVIVYFRSQLRGGLLPTRTLHLPEYTAATAIYGGMHNTCLSTETHQANLTAPE